MSYDRVLEQNGIVEIVDGDTPEVLPERRRCDGVVDGSDCPTPPVEEIRGWGCFCGKHYDETIQEVWSAADHFDSEHAATIPDDVVAEYARDFPMAAEWEARRLASMGMRLRLFENPYYGQTVPDGLIVPGMTAAEEQHRLRGKFNYLRTTIRLRAASKLREPTPNQLAGIEAGVRDWEKMSDGDQESRIAALLNDVQTLDDGAWVPYVEARSDLIWEADVPGRPVQTSAFRALLCLSQGLNPGVGVPDEWVATSLLTSKPTQPSGIPPRPKSSRYPGFRQQYAEVYWSEAGRLVHRPAHEEPYQAAS